jgi:hypothetical protein
MDSRCAQQIEDDAQQRRSVDMTRNQRAGGKPAGATGGWKASLAAVLKAHNGARRDGAVASFATQDKRADVLYAGFKRLRDLSFRMDTVTSLRGKHIAALAKDWEARELSAWPRTDHPPEGENIDTIIDTIPLPCARRQGPFLDHQPFIRDGDEGDGGGAALGVAPVARVDAVGDEFARVIALLSRSPEWDIGECPERQQLLYPAQAIAETPETSAGGRNEEEKPALGRSPRKNEWWAV